jgi:hypothetical protein
MPIASSERALADVLDDVDRLVLRLVVRARLHLGEQAEHEELHAQSRAGRAGEQQRPIAMPSWRMYLT